MTGEDSEAGLVDREADLIVELRELQAPAEPSTAYFEARKLLDSARFRPLTDDQAIALGAAYAQLAAIDASLLLGGVSQLAAARIRGYEHARGDHHQNQ